MSMKILHVDSSCNLEGKSRATSKKIVEGIVAHSPDASIIRRDVAELPGLPVVAVPVWFDGKPNEEQYAAQWLSREVIEEAKAADVWVVGTCIYNYGPPTGLKAWVDHLVRYEQTFGDEGGLLKGKRVVVVYAAGGTAAFSEKDFVCPWLKVALGMVGVEDVTFVGRRQGDTQEDFEEQTAKAIKLFAPN